MKNISRRVFIKGLAVAGVAAAASTVLAGCNTNMIPGVEDPTEDPTEEPSSNYTLTCADPEDAEKTLSITLSDMKVDSALAANDVIVVSAKVVSDLQQDIYFVDAYKNNIASSDNKYQVVVTAYPNGLEGGKQITTVDKNTTEYADYLVDTSAVAITANGENTVTKEGKLYFTVADDYDWSKVTVKLEVFKIVKAQIADSKQLVATKKFDFSK